MRQERAFANTAASFIDPLAYTGEVLRASLGFSVTYDEPELAHRRFCSEPDPE
jgi:hypothetical protein